MRPCDENSSAIRLGVGAVGVAAAAGAARGLHSSTRGSAGGSELSDGVAGVRFQPVAAPSAAAASCEAQMSGLAGPRDGLAPLRRPNLVVVIDTAARHR